MSHAGHLTIHDFSAVKGELSDISYKWSDISLALEFDRNFQNRIQHKFRHEDDKCVDQLIEEWLKRAKPEATWGALVSALKDPKVGEERLAENLAKKYVTIYGVQ